MTETLVHPTRSRPARAARRWAPLLTAAALTLSASSMAMAKPKDATGFLKARHAKVERILKKSKSEARATALTSELSKLLDYQALSKRALRDQWDGLTEAQRTEFSTLLSQLVERSYQQNLESTLEFKVAYSPAEKRGDELLVQTVARSTRNRRAPEITIDYKLLPAATAWRVVDIITDGVSLVANYRSQFNRIIKKYGWPGLIERMHKKLAEGAPTTPKSN